MAEVVEFPEQEIVLCCKYCANYTFHILMGSADQDDYKEYECTKCEAVFSFGEIVCEINGET